MHAYPVGSDSLQVAVDLQQVTQKAAYTLNVELARNIYINGVWTVILAEKYPYTLYHAVYIYTDLANPSYMSEWLSCTDASIRPVS